jgi:cytochrome c oxidase subunit 4
MAEPGHGQTPEAVAVALPSPATPARAASRRGRYLAVFGLLFVLTVLEVAVASPALGISRVPLVASLVGLAVAKAALVALFFMHLKDETRALRWTVLLPCVFPVLYALILIAEAGWRLIR